MGFREKVRQTKVKQKNEWMTGGGGGGQGVKIVKSNKSTMFQFSLDFG